MLFSSLRFFSLQSKRSSKWGKVRADHLKKFPSCASCGSVKDLEVHHIEPVSVNPDRELDPTNLITLCSKYCHFYIGHLMDYNSWNIDVIEDAQVYLNKVTNKPYKIRSTNYEESSNLYNAFLSWIQCIWRHYRSKYFR